MRALSFLYLFIPVIIFISCGPKLPDSYHMEKKYWDVSDYESAIRHMKYDISEDESLPRLSDPFTAPVFKKLVDKQNVSVVLEDDKLGVNYKNEVAQDYFDVAQDIINLYQRTDIRDKFIYPVELVKAIEFGLHTQLLYFKVGNDAIIKDAVNPEADEVIRITNHNKQTLIDNFNIYLEFLAREEAFTDEALNIYAEVISEYYSKLINQYPSANYNKIEKTINTLIQRINSEKIKSALDNVIQIINDKN